MFLFLGDRIAYSYLLRATFPLFLSSLYLHGVLFLEIPLGISLFLSVRSMVGRGSTCIVGLIYEAIYWCRIIGFVWMALITQHVMMLCSYWLASRAYACDISAVVEADDRQNSKQS